jgi:hypothetical protein
MTAEGTEGQEPGFTQNTALSQAVVQRDELFELHKHYEAAAKDERDFLFRYLNFYTGLLSAIVAATLTGLFGLSKSSLAPLLKLSLLIGPILTIIVAIAGYTILKICHRRFLQAWVTAINIRAMLGLTSPVTLGAEIRQPIYKGEDDDSFIAQFKFTKFGTLTILREGAKQGQSYEQVLDKLLDVRGDQLWMARAIFLAFGGAAIMLGVAITIAVL